MNTPDDDELHYFEPTKADKPLCKQRPGPWACQPAKDHPRGRPDFSCASNRAPVQLTSRWNRAGRFLDNAMSVGPAAPCLAIVVVAYFLYFH